MSVTDYQVAQGKNPVDLRTAILVLIALGYQPQGDGYVLDDRFFQPMILGSAANVASFEETEMGTIIPVTTDVVTITPDAYLYNFVIKPAGTIAALTVNIAVGTRNGQQCRVACSQIVTTLTNGANLAAGALALATAFAVNSSFVYVWSIANAKWERMA